MYTHASYSVIDCVQNPKGRPKKNERRKTKKKKPKKMKEENNRLSSIYY